jgi:phosphoenolpyruvate carboxykinase (GTP)
MEPGNGSGTHKPSNPLALAWVEETVALCRPDSVFWCDGSEEEKQSLTRRAVQMGVLIELNQKKLPGCYLHRSNPNDVARAEQCTFICTPTRDEAGPTNNWSAPREMYARLRALSEGAMRGRTLYVVPYLMGPPGSPLSKIGVELTDSIYVALSMRTMTRMGRVAWEHLGESDEFNRGLHCMLDVNPARRYIAHFPQDNAIVSVGSNYGGNVLLGKKCLALRIGSYLGRNEGWLAEHMLILGLESPTGEKTYVTAAFPSACGKTNFAMMVPPPRFEGWKIWTVGDDIAWMKPGADGRLYAINPEAGYFGVAPGTSAKSNPNAMEMISRDTIFTNVALTPDGDVWWEGKTEEPPQELIDWRGQPWTPGSQVKAAHPNSRFTSPMRNNPALDPAVNDPNGVPVSAIIFGGRRATTAPLVYQAFNWIHGVYVGATIGSEMTAAAGSGPDSKSSAAGAPAVTGARAVPSAASSEGAGPAQPFSGATPVGQVRRDPMAMLPFCGYNMGDYFRHWLSMRKFIQHVPRIFHVNWFRKDERGDYLWPGFGENMRVLKWIVDRCHGRANANETPLGWVPGANSFDLEGLPAFTPERLAKAQTIDLDEWRRELLSQDELFMKIYANLPKEMVFQRELLVSRL